MGGRSPEPGRCAGADGRDPERRSSVYAHGAQCAAPSVLAQLMAGAITVVVVPRRGPMRAQGSLHEDLEGRESAHTALPPVAVLERLP